MRPLGLDVLAGERVEPVEADALLLVGPLHAGLAEIVEDRLSDSCRDEPEASATGCAEPVANASGSCGSIRCGDRLSTVNGPVSADDALVLVGLIVQRLGFLLGHINPFFNHKGHKEHKEEKEWKSCVLCVLCALCGCNISERFV